MRLTGDWEAWLDFFAEAVTVTATQAEDAARQLADLADEDRRKIAGLGRAAVSTLSVHQRLLERPVATSGWMVTETGLTAATVNRSLEHLVRLDVVRELTARRRNRVFSCHRYLEILNRGAELS